MNLDFLTLDDDVITTLKALGVFKLVDSLGDEKQLTTDEGVKKYPAAYVLLHGADYQPVQGQETIQTGEVTLSVFIKTRGLRGDGSARKGAYALVMAVVDALRGYSPTDACLDLELSEITALAVTKQFATYAIRFIGTTEEY